MMPSDGSARKKAARVLTSRWWSIDSRVAEARGEGGQCTSGWATLGGDSTCSVGGLAGAGGIHTPNCRLRRCHLVLLEGATSV